MRGIKIGRAEISGPFLLLCAWLLYQDRSGVVCQGLLACLLHEAGHYAALQQTKNSVKRFDLTIFGAKIAPQKPMNYRQELFVAAAGPGVNLALAFLFAGIPAAGVFAGANLVLGAFNLLPVGELDGARILRCTLACFTSNETAAAMGWCLEFAFTVFFAAWGILLAVRCQNLTMLLMSLWLLKRSTLEKTCSI